MKKLSETYFKHQGGVVPIKSPSPDSRSNNMIRATRSPSNFERSIKNSGVEQNSTPGKMWRTPKNASEHETATQKYFPSERPHSKVRIASHNNLKYGTSPQSQYACNCSQNCHLHSQHGSEEVTIELKKLIQLINGTHETISSFEPESSEIRHQVEKLSYENQRLLSLVEKMRLKSEQISRANFSELQSEIALLNSQMNKNAKQYSKELDELHRANHALSSHIKSLEDRAKTIEKQNEGLRYLLREKEESEKAKENETKRKSEKEKLSISLIKQQYNQSMKTLEQSISSEISEKIENQQKMNKLYKNKMNEVEERIRTVEEQAHYQNKILMEENKSLRKRLDSYTHEVNELRVKVSAPVFSTYKEERLKELESEVGRKSQQIIHLNQKISSLESEHEKEISNLHLKVRELENEYQRDTEERVKQLMENYEREIRILKKDRKGEEEEVKKLRNENENLCDQNQKLKERKYDLKSEVSKISGFQNQIGNYQIEIRNNVQRINQLGNRLSQVEKELSDSGLEKNQLINQNERLKLSIEEANSKILALSAFESENQKLTVNYSRISEQLAHVESENSRLRSTPQVEESELHEKEQRIYDLELTIRNITKIMEETEVKIGKYEENTKRLSMEIEYLNTIRGQDQHRFEEEIARINDSWLQRVEESRRHNETEVNDLQEKIRFSQEREKELMSRLTTHLSGFRFENIRGELLEIKKLVNQGKFEMLETQLWKISEEYSRELLRSEEKTMEIDRMIKEKCLIEDQMAGNERIRLVLEEKVNILEGNNKILNGELRERKLLCETLLNQKTVLEKEVLMGKKVRLDKESIEATKAKAKQISIKIDRLLEVEEKRENSVVQIATTTSRFTKA